MSDTEYADYYDDEAVIERYSEYGHRGLFENERIVLDRYFSAPARVLDLGCGTGRTTVELAERGFDVVGVDVSESMVAEARRLFPELRFDVGDATDLDFEDESFDYVLFSHLVIDDISPAAERRAALAEAHRVLVPGGHFAFSANNAVNRYLFNPLSASDWLDQIRFLRWNLRERQFGSNYKYREYPDGVGRTYSVTPLVQRRQLLNAGFERVDVVKRPSRPTVWVEPRPYYVAHKAGASDATGAEPDAR